jgi:AcrR family transcriptional regulator
MTYKVDISRSGATPPKDARAVRTREALRRAQLKLLEERPLHKISIRDIATESGVGYATFFRHHATKESLLKEVAAEEIQRLVDVTMSALQTTGSSRAASLALCGYVYKHRGLWSILLGNGAVGALREQLLVISKPIANELARPNHWLPNDIAVILVITGTLELITWWLEQKKPLSIAKISEIHDRIVSSPTVYSDGRDFWRGVRSLSGGRSSNKTRRALAQPQSQRTQKSRKR